MTIASIGETTNLQDCPQRPRAPRAKVKRVVYMDGDFNFGARAALTAPTTSTKSARTW